MRAKRYNGEGKRVQKTEGNDVTNYFHQQGSVLYTTDGSGDLKAFNLLNVSDAFATSRVSGTTENYYLYTEDQRGSTVNVLDSNGNRVVSYWYSDFGEVIEDKASGYTNFVNEIQYIGAIYDELTGLLYLNARFYDPSTGRFITQDTYRGERNNADTWHLYAYCANNPINYVDPTGHVALRIVGAATGAIVGGLTELATQAFVKLLECRLNVTKMRATFNVNKGKIASEMAWGAVSGLMLTTKFNKNTQAFIGGAINTLKGLVNKWANKKKVNGWSILGDFTIGFISGYVGGDGFGTSFYQKYYKKPLFSKKGSYVFGNASYTEIPILKKSVLKQFAMSLGTYIKSTIIGKISLEGDRAY